jgi:hypothetical protein
MSLVPVAGFAQTDGWGREVQADQQAQHYCRLLEEGAILFFVETPFALPEAHRRALLTKRQSGSQFHKNVSYQPRRDVLRGVSADNPEEVQQLQHILRDYSTRVTEFVSRFLRPYAGKFRLDYASYRPVEEAGRQLAIHKRNDLLHVDAFPTRPTAGGRILRVFTNLNPSKARSWVVSDGFDWLAHHYAEAAGLSRVARQASSLFQALANRVTTGVHRLLRRDGAVLTTYDRFMHHFHNYLKTNRTFQDNCPKYHHDFPPGSTWLVYTDYVPHAVLTGQYALEQTFIVPVEAQVVPQQAPVRILERLCGQALAA